MMTMMAVTCFPMADLFLILRSLLSAAMMVAVLKLDWNWMRIAYEAWNEDDEDGQSDDDERRPLQTATLKSMVMV